MFSVLSADEMDRENSLPGTLYTTRVIFEFGESENTFVRLSLVILMSQQELHLNFISLSNLPREKLPRVIFLLSQSLIKSVPSTSPVAGLQAFLLDVVGVNTAVLHHKHAHTYAV